MTMESERSILKDGRPMMREVRLRWQKMQVVAMDREIQRLGQEIPE